VVPQPLGEVSQCFSLVELVGAGDSEGEQAFKIVRVGLVSSSKGDYGIIVLVVLLEKLPEDSPCLCVLSVLLDLSL